MLEKKKDEDKVVVGGEGGGARREGEEIALFAIGFFITENFRDKVLRFMCVFVQNGEKTNKDEKRRSFNNTTNFRGNMCV